MKRTHLIILIRAGTIIASILLTFALTSLLIIIAGAGPVDAFAALFKGALGSQSRICEIFVKAIPLTLAGLGVAAAFKGGFWNIGAEGQIYVGAATAAIVGLTIKSDSHLLLLPIVFTACIISAGIWALIPGFLKAKYGINEIILTMMMNYIAIYGASYICHGPFRDPQGSLPQTGEIAKGAFLPVIVPRTRLHAGIIIAVILCVLIYILFKYTTLGYKIRAAGENRRASVYGGINVFAILLITVFISGGLAGLAGMGEVCGLQHRLLDGISPGYGYTAIVVALLGKLHAGGVFVAALLFSFLEIGAGSMQRATGIPSALANIIEALIVIFILGSAILEKRLVKPEGDYDK